ncbi:MAG: hypothetical protein ABSD08_05745, partial [Xanthobacteraceae bacterium]
MLRTALDLTFALRVAFPAVRVAFPAVRVAFPALRVAFPVVWSGVLWPTELFEGCTVEARLARELVPGITNPRRQRCEQVSHPTLEFTARANHVSMKVGTSRPRP